MDTDRTDEQMDQNEQTEQPQPQPIKDAAASDLFAAVCPTETKVLPGIGRVVVHGLTDLQVGQWLDSCDRDPDNKDRIKDPYQNAKLIQRTVRNTAGQMLFAPNDVTRIVQIPNAIKQVLIEAAHRLCGLNDEVDEGVLKNCVRTPGSGS